MPDEHNKYDVLTGNSGWEARRNEFGYVKEKTDATGKKKQVFMWHKNGAIFFNKLHLGSGVARSIPGIDVRISLFRANPRFFLMSKFKLNGVKQNVNYVIKNCKLHVPHYFINSSLYEAIKSLEKGKLLSFNHLLF